MTPDYENIWAATFGSAFAVQVEKLYGESWQIGNPVMIDLFVKEHAYSTAERAKTIADAAVAGLKAVLQDESYGVDLAKVQFENFGTEVRMSTEYFTQVLARLKRRPHNDV